jgi:hypothetical protein
MSANSNDNRIAHLKKKLKLLTQKRGQAKPRVKPRETLPKESPSSSSSSPLPLSFSQNNNQYDGQYGCGGNWNGCGGNWNGCGGNWNGCGGNGWGSGCGYINGVGCTNFFPVPLPSRVFYDDLGNPIVQTLPVVTAPSTCSTIPFPYFRPYGGLPIPLPSPPPFPIIPTLPSYCDSNPPCSNYARLY